MKGVAELTSFQQRHQIYFLKNEICAYELFWLLGQKKSESHKEIEPYLSNHGTSLKI